MMRIATLASVVLFLGCPSFPGDPTLSIGEIEFREVTGEDDPTSSAFHYEEWKVYLGSEHRFQVSRVYSTKDEYGAPALEFEITESQSDEFEKWTGSIVGSSLAVIINGVVVTLPVVQEVLPGMGIISGGGSGFTAEEVEALIAEITAGEE